MPHRTKETNLVADTGLEIDLNTSGNIFRWAGGSFHLVEVNANLCANLIEQERKRCVGLSYALDLHWIRSLIYLRGAEQRGKWVMSEIYSPHRHPVHAQLRACSKRSLQPRPSVAMTKSTPSQQPASKDRRSTDLVSCLSSLFGKVRGISSPTLTRKN